MTKKTRHPDETDASAPGRRISDSTWQALVEGVAGETGEHFFAALVRSLCIVLDVRGAWVTEFLPHRNRLRALAFWYDDGFVEDYEYDVADTPCEPVIRTSDMVHFPQKVIELFPRDPDLPKLGAVSYVGRRLEDVDGSILGHLAVLDTRPLQLEAETRSLFQVFAARAGAELRRLRARAELQAREEKLRNLIDHAMDGIVELDAGLRIRRVNPAACEFLECRPEDAVGVAFTRFLTDDGSRTLRRLADQLLDSAERSSAWIPSGLRARSAADRVFSMEATLSRSSGGDAPGFVLIARDVETRRQAERTIKDLESEAEVLRNAIQRLSRGDELVGRSAPMRRLRDSIGQVAPTDATVLISGETGTGKELVARAIHQASPRRDRPFVTVNCAAIPSSLIESEFFGHEKGAFTGATQQRRGSFLLAHTGTLFLDEIGELPLDLQSKLLRVLQEQELTPVGGSKTHRVDVRVLAATNRDLAAEIEAGRFRRDLYFRLSVFPLRLPPLRHRDGDVALLARTFAELAGRRLGKSLRPLEAEQLEWLESRSWPGNVRELKNLVERAAIMSSGDRLDLRRAAGAAADVDEPAPADVAGAAESDRILTVEELRDLERDNVLRALERCGWKVSGAGGAAEALEMNPSTLASRIKALGLQRPRD